MVLTWSPKDENLQIWSILCSPILADLNLAVYNKLQLISTSVGSALLLCLQNRISSPTVHVE